MRNSYCRLLKITPAILLFGLGAMFPRSVYGQWEVSSAMREFYLSSTRLMGYDTIHVNWTMAGDVQVAVNEGINYLAEGNASVAVENLSQALKKEPNLVEAYYYRSVANKLLSNWGAAEFDLQNCLRLNPQLYEGHIELAKVALLRKNSAKAEQSLDRATKLAPEKPLAYYLKSSIYLSTDHTIKAKQMLAKAQENNPDFYDAKIQQGIIAIVETKRPEAAQPFFTYVIERDSFNTFARLFRSLIFDKAHQAESIKDLDIIVKRNPSNTFFRAVRGTKLAEAGQYEKSFNDLHFVIQSTYENENRFVGQQTWLDKRIDIQYAGYYTISQVYGLSDFDQQKIKESYCLLLIGEYQKAVMAINETSVVNDSALALFLKAVANEHMGNHQAAYNQYIGALEIDNDILDAHKKRGIYLTELKKWKEAEADFSDMLRINNQAMVAYRLRGVARYYLDNAQGSIDDFTKYLQYDTGNLEVIGYRAVSYRKKADEIHAALDFVKTGNITVIDYKKLTAELNELMAKGDTATLVPYLNVITNAVMGYTQGAAMRVKLLVQQGKWDLAHQIARASIVVMQVGAEHEFSYLLAVHAHELLTLGQYKEAVKECGMAIRYDNNNPFAYLIKGRSLAAMNKDKEALESLKQAAKLGDPKAATLVSEMEAN